MSRSKAPVRMSRTCTEPSNAPESVRAPSGLTATDQTPLSWRYGSNAGARWPTSQTRQVPSPPPVRTCDWSGLTAMARMLPGWRSSHSGAPVSAARTTPASSSVLTST